MKRTGIWEGLAGIAFSVGAVLLPQTSLIAETIDMGSYKVQAEKCGCLITLPDGQSVISNMGTQFFKPLVPDSYKYENFSSFTAPVVEQEKEKLTISGTGGFQETLDQEGIKTNVNVGVKFQIILYADGKMSLNYEYVNQGEDVFFDPYVIFNINYDLLKNQKWLVKKVQEKEQGGTFPEGIEHGLLSADFSQGALNLVELQINSATLDTNLGKPIVCNLSPETHLRIHGRGAIVLFNFEHYSAAGTAKMAWKVFKNNETFSIKADVLLPVNSQK